MDRRRYVPSSEGLETRNLMSTATTTAATGPKAVAPAASVSLTGANGAVAESIQTKFQRIENLPFFLGRLTKDNDLPDAAVVQIQDALRSNVAQLRASKSSLVQEFNLDLRRVLTNENIRPTDAQDLNNDFDAVLFAAGASAESRSQLRDGMNQLAQFDSTQRNSAIVVANHYATVLQVALGTGRPLLQAAKPRLSSVGRSTSGGMDFTRSDRPTFTGQYTQGAQIQIVEAGTNRVLGTSAVIGTTNTYSVTLDQTLPPGKYSVRARAIDGIYASDPSKLYTFTVRTPVVTGRALTPSGPR